MQDQTPWNNNKHRFRLITLGKIIAVAGLVLLASCGGGGGSSPPASITMGGVAAVGYPIIGGTVQVKCAVGNTISVTTTSAGAWQLTISGQTLPCAVQVSGGTINGVANTTPYQSIATSFGTVNVTPLTDLVVANLLGTATPSIWFAGLNPSTLASITPASINASLVNLNTALSGLTALSTINPVTATFTPTSGNSIDNMLAALNMAMANSGVSYATLLGSASNASFTLPAGFNTALNTAYLSMQSGSTGTGGGAGVTFSGIVGGVNFVPDTHLVGSGYVAGAQTITTGSSYGWSGIVGGAPAAMSIGTVPARDELIVSFSQFNLVLCGITAQSIFPLCSSMGINFNSAAGTITFTATPITGTSLTATGSLSFTPF